MTPDVGMTSQERRRIVAAALLRRDELVATAAQERGVDLGFAAKLAPREAIEYFRAKGYEVSWNWWEVYAEAHRRAFTVAKAVELDVLSSIRTALDRALEQGQTRRQFARELEPALRKLGWWGRRIVVSPDGGAERVQLGSPYRLRTIYDSNMRSVYGAARQRQQEENVDSRPFWMYDARNDNRVRPSHAAMDGMVFRADDPIWQTHYPPNGWNCRCRVRALTADQVKRRGLRVADSAGRLETVQQRVGVDKRTGEAVERPGTAFRVRDGQTMTPDAGWGSAPRGLAPVPSTTVAPAPDRPAFPAAELDDLEDRFRQAQEKYQEWYKPEDAKAMKRAGEDYRRAWDALPAPELGADSAAARGARKRARSILDKYHGVRRRPDGMVEPIEYESTSDRRVAQYGARQEMKRLIQEAHPTNADWSGRVRLQKESYRPAVDATSRMVDPVLLRRGRVGVAPPDEGLGDRSFVRRPRAAPGSVMSLRANLNPDIDRDMKVVSHELGHVVENANDDLLREAVAFLDSRTTGPTRPLPDYPAGEDYRPGFADDYTGKIYGPAGGNPYRFETLADGTRIRATEVISTGLEKMRVNPAGFASREPEFFDFILTRVVFRETPRGQ